MSLSNIQTYARRARDADSVEEVGENTKRALDELVRIIRHLDARVQHLEARVR